MLSLIKLLSQHLCRSASDEAISTLQFFSLSGFPSWSFDIVVKLTTLNNRFATMQSSRRISND